MCALFYLWNEWLINQCIKAKGPWGQISDAQKNAVGQDNEYLKVILQSGFLKIWSSIKMADKMLIWRYSESCPNPF